MLIIIEGLAPVAYIDNTDNLFLDTFSYLPDDDVYFLLGDFGFPPDTDVSHKTAMKLTVEIFNFLSYFFPEICKEDVLFCENIFFFIGGCNTAGVRTCRR